MKRRKLTDTVAFDRTPVFRGLALMLGDARRHGWGGQLNSADRRNGIASGCDGFTFFHQRGGHGGRLFGR